MGVLDHLRKEDDSKLNCWKDVRDVHSGDQFNPERDFSHCKVHPLSSEKVQALDSQEGKWVEMDTPAYVRCANLERNDRLLVLRDMVHHHVFYPSHLKSCEGEVIWAFGLVIGDWQMIIVDELTCLFCE